MVLKGSLHSTKRGKETLTQLQTFWFTIVTRLQDMLVQNGTKVLELIKHYTIGTYSPLHEMEAMPDMAQVV